MLFPHRRELKDKVNESLMMDNTPGFKEPGHKSQDRKRNSFIILKQEENVILAVFHPLQDKQGCAKANQFQ